MGESGLYDDPELYDLLFPAAKEITSARDEGRRPSVGIGLWIPPVDCPDGRKTESTSWERICPIRCSARRGTRLAPRESAGYDAAAQVRHVVWYVSTAAAPDFRRIEYQLRVIFPQELLLLLETVGFRLEARYGEFTRAPFEASSPRQVCVCAL